MRPAAWPMTMTIKSRPALSTSTRAANRAGRRHLRISSPRARSRVRLVVTDGPGRRAGDQCAVRWKHSAGCRRRFRFRARRRFLVGADQAGRSSIAGIRRRCIHRGRIDVIRRRTEQHDSAPPWQRAGVLNLLSACSRQRQRFVGEHRRINDTALSDPALCRHKLRCSIHSIACQQPATFEVVQREGAARR